MSPKTVEHCKAQMKQHGEYCAGVRDLLNFVGDKWSVLIIVVLGDGTRRFNELKNGIDGISQRMLTRTLRGLERNGLVNRRVEATLPPSVYYELTDLGRTLIDPMQNLAQWAYTHHRKIEDSQSAYDKATAETQ